MKNRGFSNGIYALVPGFVSERLKKREYRGSFKGAVFYIDIAGFTKITQYLMDTGSRGAERLSYVLNRFYSPFFHSTYRNRGFVSCIEGDSFISVFPDEYCDIEKAYEDIEKAFVKTTNIRPLFLKQVCDHISARAGFSYGEIDWIIVRNRFQNAFFFSGEAVSKAIKVGSNSAPGRINLDASFIEKTTNFKKTTVSVAKITGKSTGNIEGDINDEMFSSRVLRQRHLVNEFRDVIAVFVQNSEEYPVIEFVKKVSELTDKYGCYTRFSRGDKGFLSVSVFGAPVRKEGSFQRACDFALSISRKGFFKTGMTLGKSFTGLIGNENKSEYVIVGEKINLAARLMVRAAEGEILVDGDLFDFSHREYVFDFVGDENYKGIQGKVKFWSLKRPKEPERDQAEEFVGMRELFRKLTKEIEGFYRHGKFQILCINGEEGAGKSFLVKKVMETKRIKNPLVVELEKSEKIDYSVVTKLFKRVFSPDSSNMKSFEKNYSDLLRETKKSDNHAVFKELKAVKQYVLFFMTFSASKIPTTDMDLKTIISQAARSLKAVLNGISILGKNILIIENAHNIDELSGKILTEVFEDSKDLGILVILVTRHLSDMSENFVLGGIIQRN